MLSNNPFASLVVVQWHSPSSPRAASSNATEMGYAITIGCMHQQTQTRAESIHSCCRMVRQEDNGMGKENLVEIRTSFQVHFSMLRESSEQIPTDISRVCRKKKRWLVRISSRAPKHTHFTSPPASLHHIASTYRLWLSFDSSLYKHHSFTLFPHLSICLHCHPFHDLYHPLRSNDYNPPPPHRHSLKIVIVRIGIDLLYINAFFSFVVSCLWELIHLLGRFLFSPFSKKNTNACWSKERKRKSAVSIFQVHDQQNEDDVQRTC